MSDQDELGETDEPEEDELDIEIRPARDVATRAIVLATVLRRLGLEETPTAEDATTEAFDLREWLRVQGLLIAASAREQEFLARPVGSLALDEVAVWSWQGVALAALAWALHVAELDPPGAPSNLAVLLGRLPSPWDATAESLQAARLRPDDDIIVERERAELWHWRAIAEAARRESSPDDLAGIESAIADVVNEAAATGLARDISRLDFQVGQRRVRDLTQEALDELQMTTEQRLRALNWLCGFGASWDTVPLDI